MLRLVTLDADTNRKPPIYLSAGHQAFAWLQASAVSKNVEGLASWSTPQGGKTKRNEQQIVIKENPKDKGSKDQILLC